MAVSKWSKVKASLGLNLCVFVPKPLGEEDDDDDVASPSPSSGATSFVSSQTSASGLISPDSRKSSSLGLRLTKSGSKSSHSSSKKICAICLGVMKPGRGHAIFTAECSHAFHFYCITSNVKHGNQMCPVCRRKWNELPSQGPTNLPQGSDWPQEDAWMTLLRRVPRNNGSRQISPSTPEPVVFSDDEPLDHQTEMVDDCLSTMDGYSKKSTGLVAMEIYQEVSAVQRAASQEKFSVLIHLKAPGASSNHNLGRSQVNIPPNLQMSRTPVDLVCVLDVSGSMAGTKLALLKRAMGFVIQNLSPSDRLSVIAFSSTARRLFPLRRMTDSGRQQALQAVNSLLSLGGTNIAEGLRKGAKVMEERREKNPVGSIILLSDGQDTYSMSCQDRSHRRPDYQSLLPFSVRGGSNLGSQISVHAFGFGADHDAASLHSISEASGGTFSFIEAEGVIQDAFAQCIGGLLSVVVQDLRVDIACVHTDIILSPLEAGSYATEVTSDARSGFINVGDLYADEVRDFLITVNVPVGDASESTTLVKVNGVYRDPFSKETFNLDHKYVKIHRPEIVREHMVSIEVDRQRNRVKATAAMAGARVAAERGDLSSAVDILESCRKVLSESTSARAGDRLCAALDAELKEMQERMVSQHTYEVSGRAYVLSGLSSHSWQRATARGDTTELTSLVHAYRTPSMVDMVTRSQNLGAPSQSQAPIRPTLPFSGPQLR